MRFYPQGMKRVSMKTMVIVLVLLAASGIMSVVVFATDSGYVTGTTATVYTATVSTTEPGGTTTQVNVQLDEAQTVTVSGAPTTVTTTQTFSCPTTTTLIDGDPISC